MECPECDGMGERLIFACPGFRPKVISCDLCGGKGRLTEQQTEWRRRGEAMRQARLARHELQREAAARLGVSMVEYGRMERGKIEPREAEL